MFVTPTHTIFYTIEKAIKTYRKFAQKRLSAIAGDITLDQALLLLLIDEQPRLSQVEMSEMLFKDHASLTRMIALLVQNDYLKRGEHPSDGRRSRLIISPKGKQVLQRLKPVIADNRIEALQGIDLASLNDLGDTLKIIIHNCEKAASGN